MGLVNAVTPVTVTLTISRSHEVSSIAPENWQFPLPLLKQEISAPDHDSADEAGEGARLLSVSSSSAQLHRSLSGRTRHSLGEEAFVANL